LTGVLFFSPSADFLDDPPPLPGSDQEPADREAPETPVTSTTGSLAIGSLKGQPQ